MANKMHGTFPLLAITLENSKESNISNDGALRNYLARLFLQVVGVDGGVRGVPEGKDRPKIEIFEKDGHEYLRITGTGFDDKVVFEIKKMTPFSNVSGDIEISNGDDLHGSVRYRTV